VKIVGCMPVHNEEWVLGLSARVALTWCDALVILDHASTDRTANIIYNLVNEYGGARVIEVVQPGTQWDEMQHRQQMLQTARDERATHIAIIDADEILTANLVVDTGASFISGNPIISAIETISSDSILQLPGYNLRGSISRYHASGIWSNRWFSLAFIDDPHLGWHGDNFHQREPIRDHGTGGSLKCYRPIPQDNSGVMHLWGASERRLRAKHAWYKIIERMRWPDRDVRDIDAMYSWSISGRPHREDTPRTWQYKPVPTRWWEPYANWMHYLDIEADPWQEAEVRRLVAENPGVEKGFDLFGVV